MKMFLLATGALLVASAAPAFAQDGTATAAPSDSATFTGPRAEIFGGWDRVGTRERFDDGTTRVTNHDHKTAWTGGGLVGYDYPIGDKMTVGVLGSYAVSTAKTCADDATSIACLKAGREIEGGARVGYRLGAKSLVYVKGAYVNGQIRGTVADDAGDYVRGHANRDGWRAGAGVEYAVTKHAYVKAEYDYTRFKSFDAQDLGFADTSLRYDRNQVLAGFGVHF
ncbi:outer membrane protein [Sphingomonas abietis]|uniref:Outer membrane beta-barrel protein n=1 Tax=Sphingomonas abietis TaxID=3012344 RepID=A0ABY7NHJ7_9SPHN|nr:outer membrane beta-barrel protein [Sphingomonas abietis]WBO21010.1 outer membrane beta-barrel protein [Sphingomonas abietis]